MDWSPEQEQVIRHRDGNLLVSAAAGSGKTAVLVERIVQIALDEAQGTDIDRILTVTFTNLAAAQMKERKKRTRIPGTPESTDSCRCFPRARS